jgi:prophage regulatory protein
MHDVDVLIPIREVSRQLSLARSTIYRKVAEGTFPPPIKISEKAARWRLSDIQAMVRGKAA